MAIFDGPLNYRLYDLASSTYLGMLPLGQVTFGSGLDQPGTFSGSIDIASQAVQNLGPLDNTQPARTALMVDYNGAIVWGGVIWPRAYQFDDSNKKLTVTATELWSYFNLRVQATDYSSPPYSGITGDSEKMKIWDYSDTDATGVYDPMLIAAQVIFDALNYVNSGTGYADNILGGLSVALNSYAVSSAGASGYYNSGTNTPAVDYLAMTYPYTSLQQIAQIVSNLGGNGLYVGFDFAVDPAYSNGPGSAVMATVNLSYPVRGRTYAENGLVINAAPDISHQVPEDGTQAGNTMYEQGQSGSLVVSQNIYPLQQGYPVLEQIKSRSNIQSANILPVLTALGLNDLFVGSYPSATPTETLDLFNSSCPLGDFIVGDNVRWIVPTQDGSGNLFDPRFANGLDEEWRIVGYSATVSDEGQSTIAFNLALPPAEVAYGPQV